MNSFPQPQKYDYGGTCELIKHERVNFDSINTYAGKLERPRNQDAIFQNENGYEQLSTLIPRITAVILNFVLYATDSKSEFTLLIRIGTKIRNRL